MRWRFIYTVGCDVWNLDDGNNSFTRERDGDRKEVRMGEDVCVCSRVGVCSDTFHYIYNHVPLFHKTKWQYVYRVDCFIQCTAGNVHVTFSIYPYTTLHVPVCVCVWKHLSKGGWKPFTYLQYHSFARYTSLDRSLKNICVAWTWCNEK